MLKKITVIFLAVIMLLSISACNIKNNEGNGFETAVANTATNESVTYHYNTFKDRIPEPDFKETPKEQYVDGEGYYFTVTCTEKQKLRIAEHHLNYFTQGSHSGLVAFNLRKAFGKGNNYSFGCGGQEYCAQN